MDRAGHIALEEYVHAAEELYAHLSFADRQNPPRLAYLVRQLGAARGDFLEAIKSTAASPD